VPIYPLTYRHWDGERLGWWSRLRAFARTGVSTLWRSKLRRAVIFVGMTPVIFYLAFVYFASDLLFAEEEGVVNFVLDMIGKDASKLVREHSEPRAAFWTQTVYAFFGYTQIFFGMLTIVVCGAGLISADRRHNAHEIYFARPVGWADYILGKLSVIGWFLGLVLLAPATLLFLEIVAYSAKATDIFFVADLFPRICLVWLAWTVGGGLPMLALSSLSSRTGLAVFLWVTIWIGSELVADIAHVIYVNVKWPVNWEDRQPGKRWRPPEEHMLPNWTDGFSFTDNLNAIQHWLLGADSAAKHFGDLPVFGDAIARSAPGVPAWFSFTVVGSVAILSLLILKWRVRPEGAA
jgi:ABC-type transport system involved in multi-copper enzyme maturation permease subunit